MSNNLDQIIKKFIHNKMPQNYINNCYLMYIIVNKKTIISGKVFIYKLI